jgi:hypothetical protein
MNAERLRTENTGNQTRNEKPASIRKARGALCVGLSVVLTACGGGADSAPGAVATSLSKTEAAEAAAAASAAASTTVPRAIALKMGNSSITNDDNTHDRELSLSDRNFNGDANG